MTALLPVDDYRLHVLTRRAWEDLRAVQRLVPHLVSREAKSEGQRIADRVIEAFRSAEYHGIDLATELDEWLQLKGKGNQ